MGFTLKLNPDVPAVGSFIFLVNPGDVFVLFHFGVHLFLFRGFVLGRRKRGTEGCRKISKRCWLLVAVV